MNRIDFQNGSQIQTTETNHDESQDETINIWYADDKPVRICRENNPDIRVVKQCTADYTKRWAEIKHLISMPEISDKFDYEFYDYSPSPTINTIDLFNREYGMIVNAERQSHKEEDDMRILFVSPEKYDAVCSWYDNLDTVQKHRKVIVICKSPDEFREKFDYSKMNAQCTMFYFDEYLGLAKSFEYCKLFTKLYGEADVRYICGNKMRQINIDDLMCRNTFDWFKEFSVVPECLEDLIRNSKRAFVCKSLL